MTAAVSSTGAGVGNPCWRRANDDQPATAQVNQHGLQTRAAGARCTQGRAGTPLLTTKLWLAYGAFCSCAGWLLSAIHQLNGCGYLVLSLVAGLGLWIWRPVVRPRLRLRRLCRPLPAIYASLLVAAFVGGAIYAPSNYDMLTYRLPRLHHWLAEGYWHWIHTYNQRMNYSGSGWEWMSLPLLLLSPGTRLLFLLNIVSYALLPGLTFGFLSGLGVSGRVAWNWMWLLPTGLCFAMQAGGGANDAMSVPLLLAAIVFARRAQRTGRLDDVIWSALAAALLTGAKASNIFLVLPCVIALLPCWATVRRSWGLAAASAPVVLFSSLLPLLVLNHHFTGDWAGSPHDEGKLKIHNPAAGFVGNALQIGWWNLQPPLMPGAQRLDDAVQSHVPAGIQRLLANDFPRFSLHVGELPQEEGSGLGLALTALLAMPILASLWFRPARQRRMSVHQASVVAGGWIALGIFMATLGSESAARLAAPYYPFVLAAALVLPANGLLVRSRWWRAAAIIAAVSVWPAVVLTPSHPLFPAARVTRWLEQRAPSSLAVRRAATVYETYAARPDNLATVRDALPAHAGGIALLCSDDDSEISLWRSSNPQRRVIQICPGDLPDWVRSTGARWLVADDLGLAEQGTTLAHVLSQFGGHVVAVRSVVSKVSQGPAQWYVIALP